VRTLAGHFPRRPPGGRIWGGRGSSKNGTSRPSRTRGVASWTLITRVSQRRSRYPFQGFSLRLGSRSPWALGGLGDLASVTTWASQTDHLPQALESPLLIPLRPSRARPSCLWPSRPLLVPSVTTQRREDDAVAARVHCVLDDTRCGDTTPVPSTGLGLPLADLCRCHPPGQRAGVRATRAFGSPAPTCGIYVTRGTAPTGPRGAIQRNARDLDRHGRLRHRTTTVY
jgi:hypothetical protein